MIIITIRIQEKRRNKDNKDDDNNHKLKLPRNRNGQALKEQSLFAKKVVAKAGETNNKMG